MEESSSIKHDATTRTRGDTSVSHREKKLIIFTDGSSRGNPGPAGIGVVVFSDAENMAEAPIQSISQPLGYTSNNVAEYEAVIYALKWALGTKARAIEIRVDSELIYRQIIGKYKVRAQHIRSLLSRVKNLEKRIKDFSITLIPRDANKLANRLAQKASLHEMRSQKEAMTR